MTVIWILQNLMSQLLGSFTVLASLMWSGQETIYILACLLQWGCLQTMYSVIAH